MSNYRSMIDQAMNAARARAHTPAETAKIASSDSWIKEANDLAGALEFLSLSASGGDNVGAFRQEMIREFYKSAASDAPASGPTSASGTQGVAPTEGKTKIAPKGLVGGNTPIQTTASAATKDGEKAMLESFKQAGSQSLYDVLMGNKTAAAGGPAEHDSETMSGVSTANENSTYRKTLHSNEGPVNANRRELKKSIRARLAEAFAHTNDTLGDATAAQIFPQAAAHGNLKVASREKSAGAVGGALLGAGIGAATADEDARARGAMIGGATGGLIGLGGKAVRRAAIDKRVGKLPDDLSLARIFKDNFEAGKAGKPIDLNDMANRDRRRNEYMRMRMREYSKRNLKGATGVAAAAGAAGAVAADKKLRDKGSSEQARDSKK